VPLGNLRIADAAPPWRAHATAIVLFFDGRCDEAIAFCTKAPGARVEMVMPLNKTFWSSCFGMLTDRFGVGWMISVEG
jgi:uncharacterized glyoxalase superfamily protein PhnB